MQSPELAHGTFVLKANKLYFKVALTDLNISMLLANTLVSSRLDYCNSLFLSLTDFELRRLQLVQNSLCRVVTCSSKISHITPQLKQAISARERALCQLTVCFEFQSRSDRRKGHKSCALQMVMQK